MSLSDLPKLQNQLTKNANFWLSKWIFFVKNSLTADFGVSVGLTMTWFSEEILISNTCIRGSMCSAIKKSWKVSSNAHATELKLYEWSSCKKCVRYGDLNPIDNISAYLCCVYACFSQELLLYIIIEGLLPIIVSA